MEKKRHTGRCSFVYRILLACKEIKFIRTNLLLLSKPFVTFKMTIDIKCMC